MAQWLGQRTRSQRIAVLISRPGVRNFFYNFFDFSDVVSYKDFDSSACYNQTKDIVFKITYKGQYIPSLINAFEKTAHSQIADYGKVSHYRVQNMHLEYDDDYVFLFASIIDPAPPETLFTLHENKMIKSKTNRLLMFKHFTVNLCAEECVEYTGCYGFELSADSVCTLTVMKFSEEKADSQLQDSQGTNFYATYYTSIIIIIIVVVVVV
uniref:Apple domain-containing protein n=1 Tax=Octopus bimaculoides TaxID=37653 RepID=A0A0L8I455_OCTBM